MDPHTTRPVLVIPAEMKRLPRTEALMIREQRMRLHLRHSLVVATTFLVLLMALLSLSPLGSGESGIPLFDGAVQRRIQRLSPPGTLSRILYQLLFHHLLRLMLRLRRTLTLHLLSCRLATMSRSLARLLLVRVYLPMPLFVKSTRE